MIRLALLGDTYPSQVRVNPRALGDLEVMWVGQSMEAFLTEVPRLRPQVLALDFMDLGQVPAGLVPGMLEKTGARHALVSYRLAWPPLLDALSSPRVNFLRGPLPLSLLRIHVYRGMEGLEQPHRPTSRGARFTPEQLGRLMELSTRGGCACADQLARLVSGLRGVGDPGRGRGRPGEKDSRLHERLDRQMLRAREALEEGLVALMEHEHIRL
jgi:hypothetical protein